MLPYYGLNLLRNLLNYYLPRYQLAVERGYDHAEHRYNWLFRELQERVSILQKSIAFLEALPHFIQSDNGEQAMRYVIDFTSSFPANNSSPGIPTDKQKSSEVVAKYSAEQQAALDRFGIDYNVSNLPLFYIDLCEYVICSVRLYLIQRECYTHPIDKGGLNQLLSDSSLFGEKCNEH